MTHIEEDKVRENRIHMEIIVDAYDEEERAMGWYYYLEEKLTFPFKAVCIAERRISPLKMGEAIEVISMAPEEECEHEMFGEIQWHGRNMAVPLSQLECVSVDDTTREAISDWHYWIARGYHF